MAQYRPATTLIKSASYLLHDNQFSKTRALLLESADVVVQDDTGIPYRFLSQAPWQVKLYGQYHKPIRPMDVRLSKGSRRGVQSQNAICLTCRFRSAIIGAANNPA